MPSDWIAVASFSQPLQAHLARTQLEAEGIPCVVRDEYLVRVDSLLSNAVGGVKLLVPRSELERARDALRPRPRLVAVNGRRAAAEGELICPRCHSDDVYYSRYNRRVAGFFILLLGFVIPWRDRRWVCTQCGYQWKEP